MRNSAPDALDFGAILSRFLDEATTREGSPIPPHELTEGQKVFARAIRRELVKYADPSRQGYPSTLLEQMESFSRTLGDLYASYLDSGMRPVSDCLHHRRKAILAETRRVEAAGGANIPAWSGLPEHDPAPGPAFFDA